MSRKEKFQYLYVIIFSNGHVKVGRTCNPESRISAHAERVSCLGISVVKKHVSQCFGDVLQAELALINWCMNSAEKIHKREWFVGIDFDRAATEADRHAKHGYVSLASCDKSPEDEDRLRQAQLKFDSMYMPKKYEMEIPFVIARLVRDLAVLHISDPDPNYQPLDELNGRSRFEVMAAIYASTADRESIAELFIDATEASQSHVLLNSLYNELRDCALIDAKNAGLLIHQDSAAA